MAELVIRAAGDREYDVEVVDGGRRTRHHVAVPPELVDRLGLGDDVERLLRESFAFLLEREPASSILARFSLDDISRYFPEYGEELAHRLS